MPAPTADATPTCPSPGSCIAVYVNNSATPQWVDAQQIAAGDISSVTDYAVRTASGRCDSDNPVGPGTSIDDLLAMDLSGVEPTDVDHVTVQRPDGSPIVLGTTELSGTPGVFYDNQLPVFWTDGPNQVEFLRGLLADPNPCPMSGVSPPDADSNASDQVLPTNLISIDVNDGPLLTVDASATPAAPKSGQPTMLSASVANPTPGTTYSYSWQFGDGTATQPSASGGSTHSYPAGSWSARVSVTGSDSSSGFGQVTVNVPGTSKHSQPGPGAKPRPPHSRPDTHPTTTAVPHATPRGHSAQPTPVSQQSTGHRSAPLRRHAASDRIRPRHVTHRPAPRSTGGQPTVTGVVLSEQPGAATESERSTGPVSDRAATATAIPGSDGWPISCGLIAAAALMIAGATREARSWRR